MRRIALLPVEVFGRRGHAGARQALQVPLPPEELQMVTRGPAAAIAPAEGHQARGDAVLLHAVVPAVGQVRRHGLAVVVIVEMAEHAAAVDPLPPERVVGEHLAAIVVPEDFLRREMADAAALHDLRQGAGIAEHIREPEHFAGGAQLLLKEFQAMQELPDQRLAAGNISIRLNPHAAFRNDTAAAHRLLHAAVDFRIALAHHPVKMRLALQEFVFRIFLHEPQLRRKSTAAFALRLLQWPQPGHVDVGMAEAVQLRRRGAVPAGQQGPQQCPCAVRRHPHLVQRAFRIKHHAEITQPLVDLLHAQGICRQHIAQVQQHRDIQPQLIQVLFPDPERGRPDLLLRAAHLRDGFNPIRHRPVAFHLQPVPGIGLHQDGEFLATPGAACQGDLLVPFVKRAGGHPVDKHQGLPAGGGLEHHALPAGNCRQGHAAPEPAISPFLPPRRANRHGAKAPLCRRLRRQLFKRFKPFQSNGFQLTVKE